MPVDRDKLNVALSRGLKSPTAQRTYQQFNARFYERDGKKPWIDPVRSGLIAASHVVASFAARRDMPARSRELIKIAGSLARVHDVPREAFATLLLKLQKRKEQLNPLSKAFDPDDLSASDTSWKAARTVLKSLSRQLSTIEPLLHKISEDDVMCRALASVPMGGQVPELVWSVLALKQVVAYAAAIQGHRGRRQHPSWQRDAKLLCEQFWQEHKPGKSNRGYFNKESKSAGSNNTTAAGNPFSEWFYETMKAIDPKITRSNCQTLLRQK